MNYADPNEPIGGDTPLKFTQEETLVIGRYIESMAKIATEKGHAHATQFKELSEKFELGLVQVNFTYNEMKILHALSAQYLANAEELKDQELPEAHQEIHQAALHAFRNLKLSLEQ